MTATILVADDEAYILDIVATVLEDAGHTVLRARDGAVALATILTARIDLLITDNMMPQLSGMELIARLRAHPELRVPVLLMSAGRPRPLPAAVAFLPKPFDLAALDALVDRLLAQPALASRIPIGEHVPLHSCPGAVYHRATRGVPVCPTTAPAFRSSTTARVSATWPAWPYATRAAARSRSPRTPRRCGPWPPSAST